MPKIKEEGLKHLYRPLHHFEQQAKDAMANFGKTNIHSTGDAMIDEYLGGGYGRPNGYEILMIFGDTGVNKSTLATQFIVDPARKGKSVAYFSLEDDPSDLYTRLYRQMSASVDKFSDATEITNQIGMNIMVAPESDGYTLEQMAAEVEALFDTGTDIVVIDPLQFIFEASVVEKTETEFNRQRLFMRKINNVMKRAVVTSGTDKTLILVSHTNKGSYDNPLDNIMGSGANKQVPTKIIQVGRNSDGTRFVRLCKSRFTEHRFGSHQVVLDKEHMMLRTLAGTEPGWKDQVREAWARSERNGRR